MALQQLSMNMRYPLHYSGAGTVGMNGSTIVNASGEYYGVVFQAQEDMVVSHVGFKLNAATGSPTAEVRIESVSTSTGEPSGTLFDTNTNVTTSTLTTSWAVHALTASATIARGTWIAVLIKYATGTSFQVDTLNAAGANTPLMPYTVHFDGATVTKASAFQVGPSIALGSSGTTFYNISFLRPVSTAAVNAFSNSSAGAHRGARFQVPFKCRAVGVQQHLGNNAGDYEIGILDDAGVEQSSSITAIDGDIRGIASTTSSAALYFDSPVTLNPGTWYRLMVRPTSATNVNVSTMTAASADVISAMPGGAFWHYYTFTTAGGFVDTATTQFPIMSLLIDQLDDGVSSGSARVIGG